MERPAPIYMIYPHGLRKASEGDAGHRKIMEYYGLRRIFLSNRAPVYIWVSSCHLSSDRHSDTDYTTP